MRLYLATTTFPTRSTPAYAYYYSWLSDSLDDEIGSRVSSTSSAVLMEFIDILLIGRGPFAVIFSIMFPIGISQATHNQSKYN